MLEDDSSLEWIAINYLVIGIELALALPTIAALIIRLFRIVYVNITRQWQERIRIRAATTSFDYQGQWV